MSSRREEIASALAQVRGRVEAAALGAGRDPGEVELIVVTKSFPVSDAQILYEFGVRHMGENRDDQGQLKAAAMSGREDLTWHFQGQVQSRKIASISEWARVIHSLDDLSHARKFANLLEDHQFFIQVNFEPAREDRGGVAPNALAEFLAQLPETLLPRVVGLMCVAPIDQDPAETFGSLAELRSALAVDFPGLVQLSMGMSNDFEAAIAQGATQIRVGSSILGSRA